MLTQREETDLCNRAQSGEEAARQEMMESNIRLVMAIARRYQGRSMTYEDLVQEGIVGLLEAIGKFDGRKGYKFSTYATWWIRQAIVRSIEKRDRMIRLPSYGCNAERKLVDTEQRMSQELGRPPTIDELAVRTGFSRAIVQALIYCGAEPLSLDALMGEDNDTPFVEITADETAIDPEESSVAKVTSTQLLDAINELSEKEQFVIMRRYGFHDGAVWTLNDLALDLKMSREGVRHVEGRAIKKLRLRFGQFPMPVDQEG